MPTSEYGLAELALESRMGGEGTEATDRQIPKISLRDFGARREVITDELWAAATGIGFFQLVDHGIEPTDVDAAFETAAAFFALPDETKAQYLLPAGRNAGWEKKSQVRPSTGTADQKESYQLTRPRMAGLWPSEDELPGFQATLLGFERSCWELAMRVLSCFADRLGMPRDFFTRAHDPEAGEPYQSTLRLLHYLPVPPELAGTPGIWRAGAHTDFDCLTLLFQRDGQDGLQVMPGKESDDERWTPVPAESGSITCNIGDMLMRWSDDALRSTFHRVRMPAPGEPAGPRYSVAFFAQANTDVVLSSPSGRYPDITARDYLLQRIQANFAA